MRAARLRGRLWLILQAAAAAGGAWALARLVPGHPQPFFAPIAALIGVGVATGGARARQTVELVLGVAIGVGLADLLVAAIGSGAWQIALVTALATAVAVLVGWGPLFVTQAAASAILVVALPPRHGLVPTRLVDALVGGAVALAITQVLFPVDPLRLVAAAARPVLDELAAVVDDVAAGLRSGDEAAMALALQRAKDLDGRSLAESLQIGQEVARHAPTRRQERTALRGYADLARELGPLLRDVRVLALASLRLVRRGDAPAELAAAVDDVAGAVRALAITLARPEADVRLRRRALRGAQRAAAAERPPDLAASVVVHQVEALAADLLRAAGADAREAREAVTSVEAAPRDP